MKQMYIKATYITLDTKGIPYECVVKFTRPWWENCTKDMMLLEGDNLPQDDDWVAATIERGRKQIRKEIGGTAFWDLDYAEILLF